ncbi:MAG: tripartite tricarboxylate transporter permease [Candidatus Atribacteria bacterium]|nr:tripartite tricarboxylate transporter permease [Candidatus Atribacteria bacterium]
MELFSAVLMGFQVAFQPVNIFFCFLGVLIGTLVGVLPGLGPVAAISLLLPVTFQVSSVSAIIMLAGIYYGAMYGGSTTSILVNIPGEAASVITCLDGYQMARNGRAGPALGISAFASFVAGTLSILGLMFVGPLLAKEALRFGPPEYFATMILGLTILVFLASGPMWKALIAAGFGLFLSTVGMDNVSGNTRFSFNIEELVDGIGLVPVCMGFFGIAEVLANVEGSMERAVFDTKIKNLLPSLNDWKASLGPMFRGSILGFFLGILPGGSAVIATFVSYAVEKKVSKHPEKFGTGAIEGVAGPEAANNAASGGSFIPLMSLGIPSNAVMAILLGALLIHGVQPGPLLIKEHADIFWGLVASMYLGNVMLLALNLPLIGLWVKILKIPYFILFPLILLFCLIGSYSINTSITDINIMIIFGLMGYIFRKFGYEAAPLILALVLGPIMEDSLRQSLLMSSGSPLIFFNRPISLVILIIAFLLLVFPLIPGLNKKRPAFSEE